METLKTIETILELIITVCGAVFALWIYLHNKRDDTIKVLARQVIAYNCLEHELLKELSEKTKSPEQTLQKDYRQKVLKNNEVNISSYMTPGKAKSYL